MALALLAGELILGLLLWAFRCGLQQCNQTLARQDDEITECFRRLQLDFHARMVELQARLAENEQRLAHVCAEMASLRKDVGLQMTELRLHHNGEQRELRSLLNELLRVRAA